MILLKSNKIDISKNTPALNMGLYILDSILSKFGVNCIITCGCEGKHSPTSLHYIGNANDVRSRELTTTQQEAVKRQFDYAANIEGDRSLSCYDLIIEKTHFHLEFQPKK